MDLLQFNIKHIRKEKGMTQQEFSDFLGIKRSLLGAYEEGRARPKFPIQQAIANAAGISLDQLLTQDLDALGTRVDQEQISQGNQPDGEEANMRVLSITVDKWGRENIELVHQKAEKAYLVGYGDPEYLRELPKLQLPFLTGGTYRAFEIRGGSMLPLQPGSIVVGEYVSNWREIKDGHAFVIVSRRDGILYKRVFNKIEERNELTLYSDNSSCASYSLDIDDVLEVWESQLLISHTSPDNDMSHQKLTNMMLELQQEVIRLRRKIEG